MILQIGPAFRRGIRAAHDAYAKIPIGVGVVRMNDDEYPELVEMIDDMHRFPEDRISPSYGVVPYPDGEMFTLAILERGQVISQISMTVCVFRSAVEVTVESCYTDCRHRGRGLATCLAGIVGEIVLSGYMSAGQVDETFPEKVRPVICGDFTEVSRKVGEKIRMSLESGLHHIAGQPDMVM